MGKKRDVGTPGGAQLIKGLTLDFSSGHDLMVHEIEPHVRLCAECGACLGFSLSVSLCPSPACALSLYLKVNEY